MAGRTLFVVLVQMLGLWMAVWILTSFSHLVASGFSGGLRLDVAVPMATMLATCALLTFAPGIVARLCGWGAETTPDPAPSAPSRGWLRVARVAVGWYAVVRSVFPVVSFARAVPHMDVAPALWNGLVALAPLGIGVWLLWPRRTPEPVA